jgi:hypothetical protein
VAAEQQEFERGLRAIERLRTSSALRLLVGSRFRGRLIQFEVLKHHAEVDRLLAESELDLSTFEEAAAEIAEVLAAVVSDEEDFYLEGSRAARRGDQPEDRDELERKLQAVRSAFEADLPDLRRRVWLKDTATASLPGVFEWEVVTKVADHAVPRPDGQPVGFALLKMTGEPSEFVLFSGAEGGGEVRLVVDREDVAFMMDSLRRLQLAMETPQDNGT